MPKQQEGNNWGKQNSPAQLARGKDQTEKSVMPRRIKKSSPEGEDF